jgi:hypothetical protein
MSTLTEDQVLDAAYKEQQTSRLVRVKALAESGDKRARAFLVTNRVYTTLAVFQAASSAFGAGQFWQGLLIAVVSLAYIPAHWAVEQALVSNRIAKNLGGIAVGVLVLGTQLLLTDLHLGILITAGVLVLAHLANWALWLRYYEHLTGCSRRTGEPLVEEPAKTDLTKG